MPEAPMDAEEKRGSKRPAEGDEDMPVPPNAGEVQRFLSSIGLARYYPKLVGAGFDSMEALRAMEEEDMRQECGMLPGHIRLLQKHLNRALGAGAVPTAEDSAGEMSRRLAAREASSLAMASSQFGNSVAPGTSVP